MPYIQQNHRKHFDAPIERLVEDLKEFALVTERPGTANYVVSRIVAGAMKPEAGWSYTSISRAIAVLRDAATEMERRLMARREDHAIDHNGDIQEYIDES